MKLFLLLLLGSMSVVACGQQGALYRPAPLEAEQIAPKSPVNESKSVTPASKIS